MSDGANNEIGIIQKVREQAKIIARHERNRFAEEGKPWPGYRSKAKEHDGTFERLFGAEDFSDWLVKLVSERGRKLVVFEAMGNGALIRDNPNIGSGVFCELQDFRTPQEIGYDQSHKEEIEPVYGDIFGYLKDKKETFGNRTILKVQSWLRKKGFGGFDVVVCRSYAGFETDSQKKEQYLLQTLYQLTNPDHGHLVMQFGSYIDQNQRQTYLDKLRTIKGLEVVDNGNNRAILITRLSESPIRLPFF